MSKDHLIVETAWENARQLFREGRWKDCEEAFLQVLEANKPADDDAPIDCRYIRHMLDYAELLILKERNQDSRIILNNAIEMLEKFHPDETDLLFDACLAYVDTLSMADLFEDAEPYI